MFLCARPPAVIKGKCRDKCRTDEGDGETDVDIA